MSKLELFRDFVNERLAAAAFDIFGQYEKTLAEYQEEICRSREKIAQMQNILDIQPEMKLHRTGVQQLSLPEPPQIKEDQELWTSQGEEQLQVLQSDTTDSIFTSPRVKTHCDPEDSSQLLHFDQTPTGENREREFVHTNTMEVEIKIESDEEDYGAPEPASGSQPDSVTPDCPSAQGLEEEERGGLLHGLTACCPRPLPTRMLKLPIKSRRTQAKCSKYIPSPCSSSGSCLRTNSPSPWTRPIPSSHPGSESEDVSSGEAESKTAERPCQCEECDKDFSSRSHLVKHNIIHTGEKHNQCKECGKVFIYKSDLLYHRRIHTGEKLYQCEECDKTFSSKSNLVKHGKIHTGEKPYQCEECPKAFSQKCDLMNHRRIHTGEKPYKCEECDKAFICKSNFVKHRRKHTGEKRYHCQECDKGFTEIQNLVYHRRIHERTHIDA